MPQLAGKESIIYLKVTKSFVTMDVNAIMRISDRIQDFEERDLLIMKRSEEIANSLPPQNIHIERLFKGYVALGTVAPDNGELVVDNPITHENFMQLMGDNYQLYSLSVEKLVGADDKFEYQRITEEYIINMFGLVAKRWESILAYLKIWRERRLASRNKTIELYSEYASLAVNESISPIWLKRAEELFKKQIELLDYQEKHLISEESSIAALLHLFELRNKLIEMADATFLA